MSKFCGGNIMLDKIQGVLDFDKSVVLGQKQTIVKFRMFCKEDHIESVLTAEITPVLNTLKPIDGMVDFFGKVTAKILIKEQNGTVGGMSYTVDLNDEYKDNTIKSDSILTADSNVVEYDFQVDGAEVVVNAVINTQFRIFEKNQVSFLEEANIECRFNNVAYGKLVSNIDEVFSVSSQLEVKDDIARMLSSQSNIAIVSATVKNNIMQVDGKVIVNIAYVPTGEECPKSILMPFDFSQEIAVVGEGVPVLTASSRATKIRLEVFEDQKNSVFTVETLIGLSGVLLAEKEQKVIDDCYSTFYELTTKIGSAESIVPKGLFSISSKISDDIDVVAEDVQFCGLFSQSVTLFSGVAVNDGIETTGMITADIIFKSNDKYVTQKLEYPFNIVLQQSGVDVGDIVELGVALQDGSFEYVNQKISANWNLIFTANVLRNVSFNFIADVETGESLENNFGAIEVSLAFAGDNIWDVAKNLNMSLEELKILNPNLTDPLEYDQKLLVYHGIKN